MIMMVAINIASFQTKYYAEENQLRLYPYTYSDCNNLSSIFYDIQSCNFDCSPTCINATTINSLSGRPNKGNIECSGSESCSRVDSLTSRSNYVKCQGARSCYGGSSTFSGGNRLTIDARGIQCDGAESCTRDITSSNSMKVRLTGGLGDDIDCNGGDSCRGPGVIMDLRDSRSGNGHIACGGARSCKEAIVYGATGFLSCNGAESCAGIDITTEGLTYCNGLRSCQDATIRGLTFIQ